MADIQGNNLVNDTLGGTAADEVDLEQGNDTYKTGGGNDTVAGGAGNDHITVDYVTGGATAVDIDGDREWDIAGNAYATTGNEGTGVDTVKIAAELTDAHNFTAYDLTANALSTLVVADANNVATDDITLNLRNVDKLEFSNVTIDLAANDTQRFTSTVHLAHTDGADIAATNVVGNVGNVNVNAGAAADVIVDDPGTWTISAVEGTAVAYDSDDNFVYKKDNDFQVTIAKATNNSLAFKLLGTKQTVKNDKDTFTITLKNAFGETIEQKVVVTNTLTDAATVLINSGNSNDGTIATPIQGTDLDDTIDADEGNDVVDGNKGDDVLKGGFGNDSLIGGAGDDKIEGGNGTDVAIFAGAIDTAVSVSSVTTSSDGTDSLVGIESIRALNAGGRVDDFATTDPQDAEVINAAIVLSTDSNFAKTQSLKAAEDQSVAVNLSDAALTWDASANKVIAQADISDYVLKEYKDPSADDGTGWTNVPAVDATIDVGTSAVNGKLTLNSTSLGDATNLTWVGGKTPSGADNAVQILFRAEDKDDATKKVEFLVTFTLEGEASKKTGTADADTFTLGKGNDTADGGAGNDTIEGGDGDDSLKGGEGDDVLKGGEGVDKIFGGDGNDTGNGGDGNDTFTGGKGNDAFYAGEGDDGNDNYKGEEGDDTLGGGQGDDTLDGGEGSNLIFGGDDDDHITVASGTDSLEGASTAWAGDGDDSVVGGANNDIIGGGDQDDTVQGGKGDDVIYGGATGRDNYNGNDGDDTIYGGTDLDTVDGDAGNDLLFGGSETDSVIGDAGDDTLYGGAGNDELNAGKGNDVVHGGTGADQLEGGEGKDIFVFETGHGHDAIAQISDNKQDFELNNDTIDLSALGLTTRDLASLGQETKRSGESGVLFTFAEGDSLFIAGIDLGDANKVQVIWE